MKLENKENIKLLDASEKYKEFGRKSISVDKHDLWYLIMLILFFLSLILLALYTN